MEEREDIRIKVTRRSSDYTAEIAGQPGKLEAGESPAEAIGKLVISHQEELGLDVRNSNFDR